LVLLLSLGITTSLTKKINAVLPNLEGKERNHLESTYFQTNDQTKKLIVPVLLE
jgi:hypothetical protein